MIFELNDPLFLPHCSCHVRFALQEGQIIVLTGENGIGKSTLLTRLAHTLSSADCSLIEQRAMDTFYDRKLIQLKNFFLNSGLSGLDLESFQSLWTLFRLQSLESRFLSQLSGGEAQSLKLCLGLARKARWYLLDEPSQFLDDSRKEILQGQLELLASQGAGLLVVEHDQSWLRSHWLKMPLQLEQGELRVRS